MPLLLKCPKCAHRFSAPTSILTHDVACPECGHVLHGEAETGKSVDTYICHAPQDAPVAKALCATLEKNGVNCWIASRDLMAGEDWVNGVMRAIDQSRMLAFVMSAQSLSSSQALSELSRAAKQKLPVATLQIDDAPPAGKLLSFLAAGHMEKAKPGQVQKAVDALVQPVYRALGREMTARVANGPFLSGKRVLFSIAILACLTGGYGLVKSRALQGRSAESATADQTGNASPEKVVHEPLAAEWESTPDNGAMLALIGGPEVQYSHLIDVEFLFVPPDAIAQRGPLHWIESVPGPVVGFDTSDIEQLKTKLGEFGYWYAKQPIEFVEPFLLAGYDFNESGNKVGFTERAFQKLVDALREKGLDGFACLGRPPVREVRGRKFYGECVLIRRATSPQPIVSVSDNVAESR